MAFFYDSAITPPCLLLYSISSLVNCDKFFHMRMPDAQMIYFRSSLSQLANFSAMHQQGVISCENIYLSGIMLNHLHGVVQLSIGGVRWFGLGPPAVFKSYHSLHTLSRYKLMVLAKDSSQRASPGSNSLLFCQVTIAVCGFKRDNRSISQGSNLTRLFEGVLFMDTTIGAGDFFFFFTWVRLRALTASANT